MTYVRPRSRRSWPTSTEALTGHVTIQDRLVTLAEAAQLFGLHRSTLYRWVGKEIAPVDSRASTGANGFVSLYKLSEVAAIIASRHEARHADVDGSVQQSGPMRQ